MSKKKIRFSKLIFEFISVSFAVLLALFVNQWREDHNNSKLAKQAVLNINEEFVENNEVISELIINHKLILAKLDSIALLEPDVSSIDVITQSINITLINSSAWEMAKVTDAVFYIDFEDISNLAKVYSFQLYYESIIKQYMLSSAAGTLNNTDVNELESARKFLKAIIPMEENLHEYYDLVLNEILNKYNK